MRGRKEEKAMLRDNGKTRKDWKIKKGENLVVSVFKLSADKRTASPELFSFILYFIYFIYSLTYFSRKAPPK